MQYINQKGKKIKKLRKAHIWPSLVFLFLAIIFSVIMALFTVAAITAKDMLGKISVIDTTATNTAKLISILDYDDNDQIISFALSNSDIVQCAFLLDSDEKILAGRGSPTVDLSKKGKLDTHNYFYPDTAVTNEIGMDIETDNPAAVLLFQNISGNMTMSEVIQKTDIFGSRRNGMDSLEWDKEPIIESSYWVSTPIPNSENSLLLKCSADIVRDDLSFIFFALFIAGLIIILPTLFLFINVIMNVVNQRRMTKLLYTDPVTEGRSWLYFTQFSDKLLNSRFHSSKMYAIADITFMHYRSFVTFHGTEEGEEALTTIDRFINSKLGSKDICAHYGKSSFAVIMEVQTKEEGEARINGIINELSSLLNHCGTSFHAGVFFRDPPNVTKSFFTVRPADDVAEIYNRACSARATIEDENITALTIFSQEILDEQLWVHKVEETMQKAVDNEEFQVYIQPKYSPVNDELNGAEALIRWNSPDDGFISPGRFIPIFEGNGFITKIDDYMISHVAKLQAEWLAEGKKVVPVSVNVSRAHFADPDLADHICALIDQYDVPHNCIEIELTESAFFDDKDALLRTVKALKERGFNVSMDDFGAGYSSLNSLKDLPLDVLKLDADFFRGEEAERGEIVVSEAIKLAKKLNMKIVAEGVEKQRQVDFLADQGCDMIQGYYYAKPMPAAEYAERLSV